MAARPIDPRALGLSARTRELWLDGSIAPGPRLAVVGARAMDRKFEPAVEAVVTAAARAGYAIVSGGALGVDACAHRQALRHGVPQLVVLPCGPDRPYPPRNVGLFDAVAGAPQSGCLFAQPPGREPSRGMFASRNSIVVALCAAVCVVQAQMRSGTMRTGREALRRKTPVSVIRGSAGAGALAAAGAFVLGPPDDDALSQRTEQWLQGNAVQLELPWPSHLSELRARIQAAGGAGVCATDVDGPSGLAALSEAEALGLVSEIWPGRFVIVR